MKNTYGKKLIFTAITNLFLFSTVLFFSPMEIYLGNRAEFDIPTGLACGILVCTVLLLTAVSACLESLMPKKVLVPVNLFLAAAGLCFYIQSMFLNGSMGSLTGETDVYSRGLIMGNIAVWVCIFAAVAAGWLLLKKSEKTFVTGTCFVAAALMVMQLTGFVSLLAQTEDNASDYTYFTNDGEFTLSGGKNVVYFIIDTCDGAFVEEALQQDPDMMKEFTGFTYFPDNTTTHSRTYPSIPYLLSGQMCYFDKPFHTYIDDAFEKGDFMDRIKGTGADVRLFTDSRYIGKSDYGTVDNLVSVEELGLSAVHLGGFLKQTLKISAYRGLPYALKDSFRYTANTVNLASMVQPENVATVFDDIAFYRQMLETQVSVSREYSSAFRFYHLYGSHPGAAVNENAEYQPGVTMAQATRGCLKMVRDYLRMLKQQGIYENTTVIVTADHGNSGGGEVLEIPFAASCLMLVKPAGVGEETPLKVSSAPVAHTDLFSTVLSALGADTEGYGRDIFQIGETEQRDRYYYYTSLYSDLDGEVALREYCVRGDARKKSSYYLTGKNWDVLYSERAVSKNRLTESEKINQLGK